MSRSILALSAIAALLACGGSEEDRPMPPPPEPPPPPPFPPGLPTTPAEGLPMNMEPPGLPTTIEEPGLPLTLAPDGLAFDGAELASTRVDVPDGYDPEDVIFVPPSLRPELRKIAVETATDYDDVAEAYRTIRPFHVSDPEAVLELRKLAIVAAAGNVGLPEVAYTAREMRKAKARREDAEVRERASATLEDFRRRNAPGPGALIFAGPPTDFPPIEVASAMHAAGLEPIYVEPRPVLLEDAEQGLPLWDRPSGVPEATVEALRIANASSPRLSAPEGFYGRPRAKRKGPGTVVVPGGAKTPRLGPENPEPGTVSPEIEALIASGKARYHLEQLDRLAEEANGAETIEMYEAIKLDVEAHAEALRPFMDEALKEIASAAGLSSDGLAFDFDRGGSSTAIAALHDVARQRLLESDLAAIVMGSKKSPPEATSTRVDASSKPPPEPCRSAGCRTLGDCLCSCRRCRSACAARKPSR